jgi:hypothetical protein
VVRSGRAIDLLKPLVVSFLSFFFFSSVVFRASSTIEWGKGDSVAWVGVRIGPEAGAPEDMALEGPGDRDRCGTETGRFSDRERCKPGYGVGRGKLTDNVVGGKGRS